MTDGLRDQPEAPKPVIDRRRYWTVLAFFARTTLGAVVFDVVLRLPILRWMRPDPVERWCRVAGRFRTLATRRGGVLIKLGQFLSTRVDILPLEVTQALAGLQDEVPPASATDVIAQIESDLGKPIDQLFPHFDREALGAASLAQVHAAELTDGKPVVVKVLRPGIDILVETDLVVIGKAIRWLALWPFVRSRVDLDALADEFASTTRAELDLRREAANAMRFADAFASSPQVRIPKVYPEVSSSRTLTEENVAGIKITDAAIIEAAGIDREALARVLYGAFMRQFFRDHFVHADPHPGNVFVRPLESLPETENIDLGRGQPFEISLVDFGMVTEIPPRLRNALRTFVIAFGERDAAAMVDAYRQMGILLPGADIEQLTELVETILDRFWGVEVGQLANRARAEATSLLRDFRTVLIETPIQVQVDLLFTNRAIELLLGVVTTLDPRFNVFEETVPFARALGDEAGGVGARIRAEATRLVRLPGDTARVMAAARRSRLTVRAALATDSRRELGRLESALDRVTLAVMASGMAITGAVLLDRAPRFGVLLLGLATVCGGVLGLRNLFRP